MASIGSLLCELRAVNAIAETRFTVEKSKVPAVQAEAHAKFMVVHTELSKISVNWNSASAKNSEHAELVVFAAESAFATENYQISRSLVERFLLYSPQRDQYFCRAKLLLGQLIAVESKHLHGTQLIKRNAEAAKEMIIALDIATTDESRGRYDFMIFNISLRLYELVRPFLRRGTALHFAADMQKVATCLMALGAPDKEWNVIFLSATAFCLNDANQLSAAADVLDNALEIAEQRFTAAAEEEEAANAEAKNNTQLMDTLHKEIHAAEIIEDERRRKPIAEAQEQQDKQQQQTDDNTSASQQYAEHMTSLQTRLADCQRISGDLKAKCVFLAEKTQPLADHACRLYLQRIHMNPADAKKIASAPQVSQSLRNKALVAMHTLVIGASSDSEKSATMAALLADLSSAPPSVSMAETLLDCAKIGWSLKMPDASRQFAQKANDIIRENSLVAPVLMVKQDMCTVLFMLADIGEVSPSTSEESLLSTKQQFGASVHKRLEAVKLLERVMSVSQSRLGDAALTQEVCVMMWNTVLPLLQSYLRKHVYRPLQLISAALSDLDSPLLLLRTQVHFELAKCEEQFDFVVKAHAETNKALMLDYGVYKSQPPEGTAPPSKTLAKAATRQLSSAAPDSTLVAEEDASNRCDFEKERQLDIHIHMMNNNLFLRSNVYDTPDNVEGQAELNLQQIKESSSKKYRADMLMKTAAMMFEALVGVVDQEGMNKIAAEALGYNGRVPLDVLQLLLQEDKCSSALQPNDFTAVRKLILQRVRIMLDIATFGHQSQSQARGTAATRFVKNDFSSLVQKSLVYVISHVWNPSDPMIRTYLIYQIDAMCMLGESILDRMNDVEVTADDWIEVRDRRGMRTPLSAAEESVMDETNTRGDLDVDPRALGIDATLTNRPQDSENMMSVKRTLVMCLQKAMLLAGHIEDSIAVQNVLIFFWNTHLHIFRGNLYNLMMQEVHDFLHAAAETLEKLSKSSSIKVSPIDEKLRLTILEAHAMALLVTDNLQQAIDVATRAAGITLCSAYHRKRIVELLCRLLLMPGASAAKSKGVEGGIAQKFDDPFLNVFATIVIIESDATPPDAKKQNIIKAITALDVEVARYIAGINMRTISRETRDQLQEMMTEAYTRLTRANIKLGNIHSANETAEKCLRIVSEGITAAAASKKTASFDETNATNGVHKRVWRWASLCERFFGRAISQLIKVEGQDVALQMQLRVASLRHFTIGGKFGVNAAVDHLVELASVDAWNVAMPLIDHISDNSSSIAVSLITLLQQLIDSLVCCQESQKISMLKQQFYLAIIEIFAELDDWASAMETVMSAFDNVPADLQKPLWKWRVIVMSKRGKNVLDGLQKLKENDPTLQARVYAILARSASKQSVQHDAYRKALDILKDDISRADYALETAQWMASNGFAKSAVADTVQLALDAINEVDDVIMEDTISESQSSRNTSRRTVRKTVRASTVRSHQSKRRKSRSERSLDALQGERSPGLTLANFDQAMRGKAMLAMMAVTETDRTKHCLDALSYVKRSHKKWQESLNSVVLMLAAALAPAADASVPAASDDVTSLATPPTYTKLPEDLLEFLSWLPNEELSSLMKQARQSTNNVNLPCEESLPLMPLTVASLTYMAEVLETAGFCIPAMQCLAWARVCVLFTDGIIHSNHVHLKLHFMAMRMLSRFHVTCINVGSTLGRSGVTPDEGYTELLAIVAAMRGHVADNSVSCCDDSSHSAAVRGIPSWTKHLIGHDILGIALSLAEAFFDLSMIAQALQLSRCIQQSSASSASRAYAEASLLIARISLSSGDFDSSLSAALALCQSVHVFNDAFLLQRHACVLIRSFVCLHRDKDAIAVATETLKFLEMSAVRKVPANANSSSSTNISTRATLTRSTISAMRGEYGGGDCSIEMDYDAAESFVAVSIALINDALLPQLFERLKSIKSTKKQLTDAAFEEDLLSEINLVLVRATDLSVRVAGNTSLLFAKCLKQKTQCLSSFYMHFHTQYSACLQLDVDAYCDWIVDKFAQQIGVAEQAHLIILDYRSQIALPDTSLVIPNSEPVARIDMVSSLSRFLSEVQLLISKLLLLKPLLHGKHAPPLDFDTTAVTEQYTVIDKYLDATSSEVKPATLSDVLDKAIDKGAEMATAAEMVLPFRNSGAVLAATSLLLKQLAVTDSNANTSPWHLDSAEKDGVSAITADMTPQPSVSIESVPSMDPAAPPKPLHFEVVMSICDKIKSDIANSYGLRACDSSILGCLIIGDAIGKTAAHKTAGWLLTAQSIKSRDMLMKEWKRSLNCQSEAAIALKRIQHVLEKEEGPDAHAKVRADVAFLTRSCCAWNRLNINDPVGAISSSPLLLESTCVVSLVCCPVTSVVYGIAGYPKLDGVAAATKPAAKSSKPNKGEPVEIKEEEDPLVAGMPGKWIVDKMHLSEKSRRSLQTIQTQFADWSEQVAKLISSFGETLPVSLDFDGDGAGLSSSNVQGSSVKTMMRSEHAIEEQFKSMIADMETLLRPLLGKGSSIDMFVRDISSNQQDSSAVLLLDPIFLGLPWEALYLFREAFGSKVTRDFSLHLHRQRLLMLERSSSLNGGAKGGKGVSANRAAVAASAVRAVVDPFNEASKNSMSNNKLSAVASVTPQITPRPTSTNDQLDIQPGLLASYEHISNTVGASGKWRELIPRSRRGTGGVGAQDWLACSAAGRLTGEDASPGSGGALLVFCPGKVLGNIISCRELSSLELNNMFLAYICSLGQTDTSYRRQLSVDSRKHPQEVEHESPLQLAILLTLAGIGSAVIHQWPTPFSAQHRFSSIFWNSFKYGKDIAAAAADAANLVTPAPSSTSKDIGSKSMSMDVRDDEVPQQCWRLWLRYARVVYGHGSTVYNSDV